MGDLAFKRVQSKDGPILEATPEALATLTALGADEMRLREYQKLRTPAALGRVIRVDRGVATVQNSEGTYLVPNKLHLVVGDWVAGNEQGVELLERRTELVRRAGHRGDERQSMAANVDLVLVVRSLDTLLRVNRLTSLVAIAYDSGATPIVVLSKADAVNNAEELCKEVSLGLNGVETVALSVKNGIGIEELRRRIVGCTVVLLGESGAGKSSLTNVLCGEDRMNTGEVRRDGEGRHTTTHRELVIIPSGGVIIDTPGIREAALYGEREGLNEAFRDVVEVILQCRFSDCAHGDTPGCAISKAINAGELPQSRVDAYLEEVRVQEWLERRVEQRATSAARKTLRKKREEN